MARRSKALVLGDDTRSFLATARSLARHNIEVHAAPFDFSSAALRSDKLSGIHWLPYYLGDGHEWLEELSLLIRHQQIELVIPCDERAILPLDRHRSELSQLSKLAIPSRQAIEILYDKHNTRELALSVNVPVAPGRLLLPQDNANELVEAMGLPLMLKPRKSYDFDHLYVRANVRVLTGRNMLGEILDPSLSNRFIVESYFGGFGVGVSILAKDGRVLQAFQHERVHESQLTGGSSYRRAVPVEDDLGCATEVIVRKLRYTGVAMFEFRRNRRSGEYVLLEINARPWGSLPFPVALGVDFPFFWYRLLIENVEVPRVRYRSDVYSRNISQDITYVRYNVDQLKSNPLRAAWFVLAWSSEFFRYLVGREFWDSLVIDDPRPGLAELTRALQLMGKRIGKKVHGLQYVLRRRRARHLLSSVLQRRGGRIIAFVCCGNICRSPFASLQLRRFLDSYDEEIEIVSAGTLPLEGRSPPPIAILAARERGVDLSSHKSRHLTRHLADSADLIIAFDELNKEAVLARYPHLKTMVSISDFCNAPSFGEILDPFGEDATTFRETYAAITDCNRALALSVQALVHATAGNRPTGRHAVLAAPGT